MDALLLFLKTHRYKILHYASLIAALLAIQASVQAIMNPASSTDTPNVLIHTLVFFVVIALVSLAIYFKQKDTRINR